MAELPAFACPRCRAPLEPGDDATLRCPHDGLQFRRIDGIWRFLLPEREAYFTRFIHDYETVRRAEGRGSPDAAYYHALPYRDLNGRMSADWRIRAASFDLLVKRIVTPTTVPLRILDLGAGNGWLSNRLAGRGHAVMAVDLITNDFDGLGSCRHYSSAFTPVQAEFDHLPLSAAGIDLVIFNASLHYSVDIGVTLAEALRVMEPSGSLVILDSPVYHDAGSGTQMVQERESRFVARFGFPSNALSSENYLTYTRLQQLAEGLSLDWQFFTPFYGLRWALKPLVARLSGRREPARFHVIVGKQRTA